jgi:xanthine dehydrogenase accessory factor
VRAFLTSASEFAVVEIETALGSTPRERGAWMLVSPDDVIGTIGGGRLEFLAIEKARELIALHSASGALSIPLGPEIGQCCGGRVELRIDLGDEARGRELLARTKAEELARPHVFVFGCGHVGHALAAALALQPIRVTVVETRAEMLETLPHGVHPFLTSLPESVVRDAPPGSAFVVLTHDHALDFVIAGEALRRPDAAYVGMIGSKTKRATFRSWFLRDIGGLESELTRLVCPIGGDAVHDKRPPVIAALVAAELIAALFS